MAITTRWYPVVTATKPCAESSEGGEQAFGTSASEALCAIHSVEEEFMVTPAQSLGFQNDDHIAIGSDRRGPGNCLHGLI